MKLTTPVIPLEPSDSEIQPAAYLLWMDSGRPEAHDFELWLAAREMLCHRQVGHANTLRCAPGIAASAPTSQLRKN